MTSIDLILVNPGDKQQRHGQMEENTAAIEPPLLIALLAGYLRAKGFKVTIIDADAENLDARGTMEKITRALPLSIGVGAIGANPSASSTPKMTGIRSLLQLVREHAPACKTFLFGIHPSALPERTLKEEACNFVVRGEPFYAVEGLLRAVRSGKSGSGIQGLCYLRDGSVVDSGWADLMQNLDDLPQAAWDMLPMGKYRAHNWHCLDDIDNRSPYAAVYTGMGCPFNCHYCNVHALYDGKPGIRFRSAERVLEDVDCLYQKYNVRRIKIVDELFVTRKDRLFEICDLLTQRDYGLNLWAYARVDTVSEDILRKLKRAGFQWLAFGIEAGSHEVRKGVSKGGFDPEMVRRAIAMTHEAGISVIGNFMFGLPDDGMASMGETLSLAQSLDCEYVNFYTTMAYPGSLLYEEALDRGIKLPESWNGYAQLSPEALPLPTKHLTAAQVLEFRDAAFEAYYRAPRYLSMIQKKFGARAVAHIQQMLKHKPQRKILSAANR